MLGREDWKNSRERGWRLSGGNRIINFQLPKKAYSESLYITSTGDCTIGNYLKKLPQSRSILRFSLEV